MSEFLPVGEQVSELDNTVRETGASDSYGHPVQEIESLCMNCHKQGTTRLLLTQIPYFREVVIMLFSCPHCGFQNLEIQPAGSIQEKGARYVLVVESTQDFNRQVVKSDLCTVLFPQLDTSIPAGRGQMTTVEGLLSEMADDLMRDQEEREKVQPEQAAQIAAFVERVRGVLAGKEFPFKVVADDPAGNSWIEFVPDEPQHKWSSEKYLRTPEQNEALGLAADAGQKIDEAPVEELESLAIENLAGEVQTFQAHCLSCGAPCETHMKQVTIPHFKDVIIMLTVCDHCGYKLNEVKTGGAIPAKGKRVTLKVTDPEDLARDILKLESCKLEIPELGLDLLPGTLGGRFTTIEGLIKQVREELDGRVFQGSSDLMDPATREKWELFFARMDEALAGNVPFTVVMEDPLALSYIQNVYAPDPDPEMVEEEFERTHEQNEDLGLNDIDVGEQ